MRPIKTSTIDATSISKYMDSCPVIEIPGRTFPVTEFYLEDVLASTGHNPENIAVIKSRKIEEDESISQSSVFDQVENLSLGVKNKLIHMERDPAFQIDYGLISSCVRFICDSGEEGAILIFLPGVMEIKKAIVRIKSDLGHLEKELEIFPLHSI